jgi:hypothetical protein
MGFMQPLSSSSVLALRSERAREEAAKANASVRRLTN